MADNPCESFDTFKERMRRHKIEIRALNPYSGCVAGRKWDDAPLSSKEIERLQEEEEKSERNKEPKESERRKNALDNFLRSAAVSTVVIYEGYVQDLITEAFEFTGWRNLKPEDCEKRWPACKGIVTELIESISNPKGNKGPGYFYIIMQQENPWQYLLSTKHLDVVIKHLSSGQPSLRNILKALTNLFVLGTKKGSSTETAEFAHDYEKFRNDAEKHGFDVNKLLFKITWSIYDESGDDIPANKFEVQITHDVTVRHLLNLFYSIRCSIVHGKKYHTLDRAFKDFPNDADDLKLDDREVAEDIMRIANHLRDQARNNEEFIVDYLLCVNMNRFFFSLALSLMKLLKDYISKKFLNGEKCWSSRDSSGATWHHDPICED